MENMLSDNGTRWLKFKEPLPIAEDQLKCGYGIPADGDFCWFADENAGRIWYGLYSLDTEWVITHWKWVLKRLPTPAYDFG